MFIGFFSNHELEGFNGTFCNAKLVHMQTFARCGEVNIVRVRAKVDIMKGVCNRMVGKCFAFLFSFMIVNYIREVKMMG